LVSTCEWRALRSGAAAFFLTSAAVGFLSPSPATGQMMVSSYVRVSSPDIYDNEPAIAGHGDRMVAAWRRTADGKDVVGWDLVGRGYWLDGGMSWRQGGGLPYTSERIGGLSSICATDAGEFYSAAYMSGVTNEIGVYHGVLADGTSAWTGPPMV